MQSQIWYASCVLEKKRMVVGGGDIPAIFFLSYGTDGIHSTEYVRFQKASGVDASGCIDGMSFT